VKETMKVKEFLWPDKKKLVVFVIIALLAMSIGVGYISPWGMGPIEQTFYNPIFWLPVLLIYGRIVTTGYGDNPLKLLFQIHPGFSVGAILSIPYWYLLSCLLVSTYNKLKTKGKKHEST